MNKQEIAIIEIGNTNPAKDWVEATIDNWVEMRDEVLKGRARGENIGMSLRESPKPPSYLSSQTLS